MELSPDELAELGRFFAKRFPDAEERALLLAEASLDDSGSWEAIVFAAADAGTLGQLARAASERRPKDDNLTALVTTLGADSVLSPKAMGVAAIALALIGVGAAAWYGIADDRIDAKPEDPRTPRVQLPVEAPGVEPGPAIEPVPAGEPLAPEPEPEARAVDPEVQPEAVPTAPAPEVPADEPVVPLADADGRCGGPEGALVGYWYAGHPFEPEAGDSYTLKFGKYVRAEYPHRDNGWRADGTVRCTLMAGDTVRVSAAPILVDGGKYWVPLAAGDLLTP